MLSLFWDSIRLTLSCEINYLNIYNSIIPHSQFPIPAKIFWAQKVLAAIPIPNQILTAPLLFFICDSLI